MLTTINKRAGAARRLHTVTCRCAGDTCERALIGKVQAYRIVGNATMETLAATPFSAFVDAQASGFALLPDVDLDELRRLLPIARRRVRARQHLYHAGQAFGALYLVHAGFLKTCHVSAEGREQVTGFRMRGDLVGVEAIGLARHIDEAVALEDSEVWELSYPAVLSACQRLPALQARLTAALAEEIRRDRHWVMTVGALPADERVAAFLLGMAARFAHLGFSAHRFVLRMTRLDMASFLALKHETVSRALTRLERAGLIRVACREIELVDGAGLRRLCGSLATH